MDALERAVRNALEKGDASERAFREKVYRSAFAALDRALVANAELTEESRARRRAAMKSAITQIESEFVPAVEADPPVAAREAAAPELTLAEERPLSPRREPDVETEDVPDELPSLERDDERVERASRRSWAGPVVFVLLLAAVAAGGWWAWQALPTTTSPPPAAQQPAEEEAEPPAEQPAIGLEPSGDEEWMTIFSPGDPTTVTATGGASAETIETEGQSFVRIRSGSEGVPVRFEIGQGVLERLAGRRAVFSILAGADEEEVETQISVDCDLAELGDCSRRRYHVGITREEFLFGIDMANVRPSSGGTISINSDIEGQGRSLDVLSIRVAPMD